MKQKILLTLICALAGALSALAAKSLMRYIAATKPFSPSTTVRSPMGRILLLIVLIQHGMSMVLTVMCFM